MSFPGECTTPYVDGVGQGLRGLERERGRDAFVMNPIVVRFNLCFFRREDSSNICTQREIGGIIKGSEASKTQGTSAKTPKKVQYSEP